MRPGDNSLEAQVKDIENLVFRFGIGQTTYKKAMVTALNKTIRTISARSASEIGKDTKVKVSILRQRMKIFKAMVKNMESGLSMLVYSVPAAILGKPHQTKYGVTAGQHRFYGKFTHFVRRKRGGARDMIFERKRKTRYPLREVRIPISDTVHNYFDDELLRARDLLLNNFIKEIERISKWRAGR